eukprot:scaffold3330_cov21-Phaeocystis_antarctica.AAC.1
MRRWTRPLGCVAWGRRWGCGSLARYLPTPVRWGRRCGALTFTPSQQHSPEPTLTRANSHPSYA